MAGAGTASTIGAGLAIGTADAFFAAFFGFDDIGGGRADNQHDHCDQNIIDHGNPSFLKLCLHFFVFAKNDHGIDGDDDKNDCPAENRHPNRAEIAACEESSEEKHKEG